jgi:hypothetical protein
VEVRLGVMVRRHFMAFLFAYQMVSYCRNRLRVKSHDSLASSILLFSLEYYTIRHSTVKYLVHLTCIYLHNLTSIVPCLSSSMMFSPALLATSLSPQLPSTYVHLSKPSGPPLPRSALILLLHHHTAPHPIHPFRSRPKL